MKMPLLTRGEFIIGTTQLRKEINTCKKSN